MDPSETKYQYLIKKRKKMVLNDWKIQRLLLNIQIISMVSMKTLKVTIQKKTKDFDHCSDFSYD